MTGNATAAPLLRRAMQADAAMSGASGTLLTLLPGPLSVLIGFERPVYLLAVGVGLIGYAAWLLFSTRRPEVNIWAGRVVIFLNLLWVAASAVLLLAEPSLFNGLASGWWAWWRWQWPILPSCNISACAGPAGRSQPQWPERRPGASSQPPRRSFAVHAARRRPE